MNLFIVIFDRPDGTTIDGKWVFDSEQAATIWANQMMASHVSDGSRSFAGFAVRSFEAHPSLIEALQNAA